MAKKSKNPSQTHHQKTKKPSLNPQNKPNQPRPAARRAAGRQPFSLVPRQNIPPTQRDLPSFLVYSH